MKKTILCGIIASLLTIVPVTSFAGNNVKTQNSTQEVGLSTPELKKLISSNRIALDKLQKEVDSFFEKRATLGEKFTDQKKLVAVEALMSKIEASYLPDIDEDKYPEDLSKAYKENETTYRYVLQQIMTAVLQQTFDEGKTGVEFKVKGDNHQTLMVTTPKGSYPKMTTSHFPDFFKAQLLAVGFENVLFTNFDDDTRLVPILLDTEGATDLSDIEKNK